MSNEQRVDPTAHQLIAHQLVSLCSRWEVPMSRLARGLILTLVLGTVALPPLADAQQLPTVRSIGILHPGAPPPPTPRVVELLMNGLRRHGYGGKEGVPIEVRYGSNRSDRLGQYAREFV